jgi:hypothetical protein
MTDDLIIRPKMQITCGNCRWLEPTKDLTMGICHGSPPTPVVAGMRQTAMGMQPEIVTMNPTLPRAYAGCALFTPRDQSGSPTQQ